MPSKPRKRRLLYHNRNRIKLRCPSVTQPPILSHSQRQSNRTLKEHHLEQVLSSKSESKEVKLNHGLRPQHRILSLIMAHLTRAMEKIRSHSSPMARVERLFLNQIISLTPNLELLQNLSLSGNDNNRKYRWIR